MNDFLEWLDEQDDPAPRHADGCMCDTIDKAEAAARRLRAATDALAAIEAVQDRIIADARAWREEAGKRHDSIVLAEQANLETFLRVQIAAGGPKSAPLPWGVSVKARKTGGTLVFADGFADEAPDDVVRSKVSIDAAKAKAYYRVADDGTVVDPNGEVVEAVTVAPVADKFEVVA